MKLFKPISRSFSRRFSMYIILIVGTFTAISFFSFINLAQKSIEKQTEERTSSLIKISNLEIEKVLLQAEMIPDNYKQLITNCDIPIDSLYSITRQIVRDNPLISGSAIAFEPNLFPEKGFYFSPYSFKKGDSIVSTQLGNSDYDYFSMDWYLIPKLLQNSYWSEPYYDEGGGEMMMITYSSPMYDKQNRFIGIFTIDISLEWLCNIANSIKPYPNAYTFVIGRGGTYIVHKTKERILNETIFSIGLDTKSQIVYQTGQKMVDGKIGSELLEIDSVKSYIFYAPIPRIGWSIGMVCPYDEVFANLLTTRRVLFIVGVIALFLIFLFCYIIIRRLSKPLQKFAVSANQISSGNLNVELPVIKSHDEMKDLRDAFENMQHDLSNYIETLKETTTAKEKIESELRIARDIQMGMIPKIFPPYPDRNDLDIFAILTPAKEVGGDLYDFMLDGEQLYFTIGDVSGKGIPASLLMAVTRSLFRSVSSHLNNPAKIVEALNDVISDSNESNMFVTMFIGILDLKTGHLRYCNAGHNAPIIKYLNGESIFIPVDSNLPVGVLNGFEFSNQEMDIQIENTLLLLYTDGLTEAENIKSELYGEKRLFNLIEDTHFTSVHDLVNDIIDDIAQHVQNAPQSDDLTILTINIKNELPVNQTLILENRMDEIAKLHTFIEEISEMTNLSPELTMQIDLAMEEIVANVIMYAYEENSRQEIKIIAEKMDDYILFSVIDSGIPFDPTTQKDPDITLNTEERPIGGLGVFMAKQLMDEITYSYVDRCNVLKMKKIINKQ